MTARGIAAKPRSGRAGHPANIHRVWAAPDAAGHRGGRSALAVPTVTGSDARPSAAPSRAPAIAALVSVSPPLTHGCDQCRLHRRARGQVKKRVLQGDQHPTHLVLKIRGSNASGSPTQRHGDRSGLGSGRIGYPERGFHHLLSVRPQQSGGNGGGEGRHNSHGRPDADETVRNPRRRSPRPRPDRWPTRRSARCASAIRCFGCPGRLCSEQPEPCHSPPTPQRRTLERWRDRNRTACWRTNVRRRLRRLQGRIGASAPGCVPMPVPIRSHRSAAPPTYATPGLQPDCAPRWDKLLGSSRRSGIPPGTPGCRRSPSPACSPRRGRTAGLPPPEANPA